MSTYAERGGPQQVAFVIDPLPVTVLAFFYEFDVCMDLLSLSKL